MAPKRLRYDPSNDYYKILDVSPRANADEIHRAFRKQAKTVHPDVNPERSQWAHEQFQHLTAAHDILGNSDSRANYDELRRRHLLPTVSAKPVPSVSLAEASRAAWAHRSRRRRLSLPYQLSLLMLLTGGLLYVLRGLPDYEAYQREVAASAAFSASPVPFIVNLPTPMAFGNNASNFLGATLPAWSSYSSDSGFSGTSCGSPDETIVEPRDGDTVQVPFRIIGTASGSDFVSYNLAVIDGSLLTSTSPRNVAWTALATQIRAPVRVSLLVPENETRSLIGHEGDLVLRLSIDTSSGKTIPPCEVTFHLATSNAPGS